MKKEIFIIIGVFFISFIAIVYVYLRKKENEKRKGNFYLVNTKTKSTTFYKIYDFFHRIPIIKVYMDYIYRQQDIYCPGDVNINKKRTIVLSMVVWFLSLIEVYGIFAFKPSVFRAVVLIILIYVVNTEAIYFMVRRSELKLFKQMITFFEDVRHYYYSYKNINMAIEDALRRAGREIKAHGQLILEALDEERIDQRVRSYNERIQINYLKLFLSLCVQVKVNGDCMHGDEPVFQTSLHQLKKEIQNEVLKMSKIIFMFSGLVFMAISPILIIEGCRGFGLSLVPELVTFYDGTVGLLIKILSIVIVLLCYMLITIQRDLHRRESSDSIILRYISDVYLIRVILDNYTEKYYTAMLRLKEKLKKTGSKLSYRQFKVKQVLFILVGFAAAVFTMFTMHNTKKYSYVNNILGIEKSVTSATKPQIENMHKMIKEYVIEYKDQEEVPVERVILYVRNNSDSMKDEQLEVVCKEVEVRITKYRNEYFKWYELLICIAIALFSYEVPYIFVVYRMSLIKKEMEQEVIQFHSIIMMLMYIKNISILEILEMMETFAFIFKDSLQKCINDFGSGSELALMNLAKDEPYELFVRIIENLITSDKIGIVKAFDEISSERVFFLERRKDEDAKEIQKKTDNATILAYVPLAFIFAGYLIIPFMLQCIKDYMTISASLN